MSTDECRPVTVEVDGQAITMQVHGNGAFTTADREALEALAAAALAKLEQDHPHAGLVQELMSAWMSVRRQLPANDSRLGRDRNVAAVKQRMSAAIAAVREALEGGA